MEEHAPSGRVEGQIRRGRSDDGDEPAGRRGVAALEAAGGGLGCPGIRGAVRQEARGDAPEAQAEQREALNRGSRLRDADHGGGAVADRVEDVEDARGGDPQVGPGDGLTRPEHRRRRSVGLDREQGVEGVDRRPGRPVEQVRGEQEAPLPERRRLLSDPREAAGGGEVAGAGEHADARRGLSARCPRHRRHDAQAVPRDRDPHAAVGELEAEGDLPPPVQRPVRSEPVGVGAGAPIRGERGDDASGERVPHGGDPPQRPVGFGDHQDGGGHGRDPAGVRVRRLHHAGVEEHEAAGACGHVPEPREAARHAGPPGRGRPHPRHQRHLPRGGDPEHAVVRRVVAALRVGRGRHPRGEDGPAAGVGPRIGQRLEGAAPGRRVAHPGRGLGVLPRSRPQELKEPPRLARAEAVGPPEEPHLAVAVDGGRAQGTPRLGVPRLRERPRAAARGQGHEVDAPAPGSVAPAGEAEERRRVAGVVDRDRLHPPRPRERPRRTEPVFEDPPGVSADAADAEGDAAPARSARPGGRGVPATG